jgi:hypothetical protein
MNTTLKEDSPIYEQLRPLDFMNYLVGSDDITADKDFKHVFKHVFKQQRNLMMRNKRFIQGFCITLRFFALNCNLTVSLPFYYGLSLIQMISKMLCSDIRFSWKSGLFLRPLQTQTHASFGHAKRYISMDIFQGISSHHISA